MDEILYNALSGYYHALELRGYMPKTHSDKLLVLAFYRDFMFHDYRAVLSKSDYRLIEEALDCLYGTSCLIPYPDYLKMGKLHLGEMTEIAQRLKNLEETDVVKVIHNLNDAEDNLDSDICFVAEEDDSDE